LRTSLTLTLVCFLTASTLPAAAQAVRGATSLRQLSDYYQELAERVDPAVVQIITRGFAQEEASGAALIRTRRSNGSGVIVDSEGYIVTNAHVVGAARSVQVLLPQPSEDRSRFKSILKPSGKLVNAQIVGADRETDIAVLKIDGTGYSRLPFSDSEKLRQGQIVFAFGSPFGLENSVTSGIISSVARQLREDDPMIYIQTDAAINPGNSGGPLVNAEGEIAGINTFQISQGGGNEGIGFAVPANVAKSVYEQIRKHGRVRRGQIGVIAQTITPELAQSLGLSQDWGVILADIAPSGAAQAAGLEIRDIVVSFNGKLMENARQFGVNIYQCAGETVTLEILRGTQKLTKRVAVLERPRDPDRLLSLAGGPANVIPQLGIVAVDLDERSMPVLPPLRRLSGVVVAGLVADSGANENVLRPGDVIYAAGTKAVNSLAGIKEAVQGMQHGLPVALHIERAGQLQFVVVEIN